MDVLKLRKILVDERLCAGDVAARHLGMGLERHGLPEPDEVYGWECPPHQRKPSPWPVEQIMAKYRLKPGQVLVLDDLKPGHDMARACGVNFAAAGWANDIPEIERFMRENCEQYFKTVEALGGWLFPETQPSAHGG